MAFTIECDNEFEHRMPHRTALAGGQGPWLASLAMWWNCMQFVGEEGISARDLERRARTRTNLDGMRRWGYIEIGADSLIRPTGRGRRAQEVWQPLAGMITARWADRFGAAQVAELERALGALASQFQSELPDCMPILGYGLFSDKVRPGLRVTGGRDLPLPALLARVLLALALEFERGGELSLAMGANVVRVLDEKHLRIRDLPLLSGVSKEAIGMATGFLGKRGYATVETDPAGSRAKVVRLTSKGREARDRYRQRLGALEELWQSRYGQDAIGRLRAALEPLAGDGTAGNSPLFRGLDPYPDGWRASVPKPRTLPHFPMVLHRGGYPDGS